jgi:Holliday junction resolvasome RuvABC endonuclease subunit
MKILGIDPASAMGWALIEDDKLLEYGTIKAEGSLNIQQKLNYYSLEIDRLLDRLKPDYCSIEDIIMGISGVKVLVYLSRINAMAILSSVKKINSNNVFLYAPTEWKSSCDLEIDGGSKKWEIQWGVCNKYNLVKSDDAVLEKWKKIRSDIELEIKQMHVNMHDLTVQKSQIRTDLNRVRKNVLVGTDREKKELELKYVNDKINSIKNGIKQCKKDQDKKFQELSNDIYYKTGISSDIADSIGLALCLQKNLKSKG